MILGDTLPRMQLWALGVTTCDIDLYKPAYKISGSFTFYQHPAFYDRETVATWGHLSEVFKWCLHLFGAYAGKNTHSFVCLHVYARFDLLAYIEYTYSTIYMYACIYKYIYIFQYVFHIWLCVHVCFYYYRDKIQKCRPSEGEIERNAWQYSRYLHKKRSCLNHCHSKFVCCLLCVSSFHHQSYFVCVIHLFTKFQQKVRRDDFVAAHDSKGLGRLQ